MSAATSRPQSRPRSGPRRPPQQRAAVVPVAVLWRNAAEGAASALLAVSAMVGASVLALVLLGADGLWTPALALTAMAVGGTGSVTADLSGAMGSAGSGLGALFGGGGMSPSVDGSVALAPLGVTLVGTVALWFAFSWRLRRRRVNARELAVRVAATVVTAPVLLMIVAGLAAGTVKVSTGAVPGLSGLGAGKSGGGLGGAGLGGLFGGLTGSGGKGGHLAVFYQVGAVQAGFGTVVWVAVVLAAGFLISRHVRLPAGSALDRLRPAWSASLSAVIRTVLVIMAVLLVLVAGLGLVAGGRAGTAAGAAVLLAPNALAVLLTLGVGAPWTAGVHPAQSQDGGSLGGLMSMFGGGQQGFGVPDRTEHLRSLSAAGWPLWLAALAVTGLVLLGCGFAAARATGPVRPLHPYGGPLARHLGLAERFGVVTAVVFAGLAWLAGGSGQVAVSIFGSQMLGAQAQLGGAALSTAALGLLVGGLAGLGGSTLSTAFGPRGTR